jgi:hypothetical protein
MLVEIDDTQLPLIINALDHYNAYLVATKREDSAYLELAQTLRRKAPEREVAEKQNSKKKRA